MIFLDYQALTQLLPHYQHQAKFRTNKEDREQIRQYRHQVLSRIYPNLILTTTEMGKPICENYSHLAFNHSHSQGHYALAYSETVQDLGVDVEDFSRNVRMQALAERSFHPEEYAMWQQLDYCRHYWFKVWTIKEAVLKAHGLGIRLDLHSLNTHAHPTWDFGRVEHPLLGVFIYQCLSLPCSMLTVAYRQQQMDLQLIQLNM